MLFLQEFENRIPHLHKVDACRKLTYCERACGSQHFALAHAPVHLVQSNGGLFLQSFYSEVIPIEDQREGGGIAWIYELHTCGAAEFEPLDVLG